MAVVSVDVRVEVVALVVVLPDCRVGIEIHEWIAVAVIAVCGLPVSVRVAVDDSVVELCIDVETFHRGCAQCQML